MHNALEQSPPGWKMTPCMAAAAGGHVDVVRALLDAKANADAIDASTNLAIDWARHECWEGDETLTSIVTEGKKALAAIIGKDTELKTIAVNAGAEDGWLPDGA